MYMTDIFLFFFFSGASPELSPTTARLFRLELTSGFHPLDTGVRIRAQTCAERRGRRASPPGA